MRAVSRPWKILMMGYVWPEVTSSAAGLRDWNLINSFMEQSCEVVFSSQAKENKFTNDLKAAGVKTIRIEPNQSWFDSWIREESPDFVIFDRYVTEEQFGWRVEQHSPSTARILDTQDLHFLRKSRHAALLGGASLSDISSCNIDLTSEVTLRELASIYRCDSTLIISDFEMKLLISRFKVNSSHLFLHRFHYPPAGESPPFHSRKHFCMIGNFRHAPNSDAVQWLRQDIWPRIRNTLTDVEMHVYGAYAPKEMMQWTDSASGFHVKGPVKDHLSMMRKYRVNLAPLRFGAGIKGKITDGWYCGTPVVTTPIGSEGMHEHLPFGGEVCIEPEEIAKRAVKLYCNQDEWNSAERNGKIILEHLYDLPLNSASILSHLADVKENLEHRRKNNVIGSILQYQLNRGTKYFSLWIEEKNKNRK